MRARNVDINGLERELAEFRDIIDGWVNENVARERRLKDAHERNLHRLERAYEGLIERERNLSERAAENQAEAERYELEAEQALEEANAARELADGLPEQLALLREQVRLERMSIDRAKEKVTSASAMAKLDALRHASATYAERLGLRFEYGDAEKLRLAFKYVDAAAPEREFVLGVRLRGSAYEVVECAPRLENIDALVDECNRTNDFGKFVRDARRGFVAEANANGETRDARAPPKKGIDVDRSPRPSSARVLRSSRRRLD